ncbi:ABC transporter permease [Paracoccus onubensis]|uniref:FtsX-like permease family protein n=1 Tax=Paracoccus onubensis TaxID=1675788 RepID=A0A418SXY9_9RHOB|nr:FtsX-like permease family protein [Paracoccus onubensis]RJE85827.1 FtsX-like permease family protein [Paracoccus onubensis]
MRFLSLILANASRGRARLAFTLGSVVVAFLLLGLMLPVLRVFDSRVDFADANRLMVLNKASMMRPLPINYKDRIAELDNVEEVGHFTFFGAAYQSGSNQIPAIVTEPENFPVMVEEVEFRDADALSNWQADPSSIAVGRDLANKHGWKIGDLVPLHSSIYNRSDGNPVWTFRVGAIFDGAAEDSVTDSVVIPYEYFNNERIKGEDTVGWFAVRIADANKAEATGKAIDVLFENSPNETATTTERAFAKSFLNQVGDFKTLIGATLILVFWTLILITANAQMQSIRERFGDFAVMRILGFRKRHITRIILSESLLTMFSGGIIGMAIAGIAVLIVSAKAEALLSLLSLDWRDWLIGAGMMIATGVIVATIPAILAARQNIIDGLAETL